jgi:hypothetical protein
MLPSSERASPSFPCSASTSEPAFRRTFIGLPLAVVPAVDELPTRFFRREEEDEDARPLPPPVRDCCFGEWGC